MEMQNPRASESQETLASLQFMEPVPVPDSRHSSIAVPASDPPKSSSQSRPSHPPKRTSTLSSALGLSGSGHSSVYYLTRLQKYSSYVFTVYASFHITNTSLIPLITGSVEKSEKYLLLTRPYYQSFPLEPLLITLPLATHILAGLALRIHRRNTNLARYGGSSLPLHDRLSLPSSNKRIWPPVSWSSLSGYILTPLVVTHAVVNRTIPWIYEGGSSGVGLGFVSHGFAKHPWVAWTGYAALVGVAAGHFVWGVARWNGWIPIGNDKKAKRRWWVINGIAAALAGLWAAGGLGIVGRGGLAEGWVGRGYDELYSKVPLVGL